MTTFQVSDVDCPVGVVDVMLWRDAEYILRRHCDHTGEGLCVWCGREWPCGPRRLAERAQTAAYRPLKNLWSTPSDRPSLSDRPTVSDRPLFGDRPSVSDRPSVGDRPSLSERPSVSDRPLSGERPSFSDRPGRLSTPTGSPAGARPAAPTRPAGNPMTGAEGRHYRNRRRYDTV